MIRMVCKCKKCKKSFEKLLPDNFRKKLDKEKECIFCGSKTLEIDIFQ